MKRLLLTAALAGTIITAAFPAVAQTATDTQNTTPNTTQQQTTQKKHWRHHRHQLARMAKKLNLSQDQQNQLKPVFQQQHQQAKAIRDDASLTQDQKKEKFQALRQDTMAKVNGILTPEQQQQWQQMRAKHQHGTNGDNQPPAAAPQG